MRKQPSNVSRHEGRQPRRVGPYFIEGVSGVNKALSLQPGCAFCRQSRVPYYFCMTLGARTDGKEILSNLHWRGGIIYNEVLHAIEFYSCISDLECLRKLRESIRKERLFAYGMFWKVERERYSTSGYNG